MDDAATAEERPPYVTVGPEKGQPYEWRAGHIANAHLIPLDGIYAFGRGVADLPRDADLIFVCEAGQRSAVASEIALVAGFAPQRVHNLAGGMSAWRRMRLPVER
jgi:rhodanese-related sulfurtransferase